MCILWLNFALKLFKLVDESEHGMSKEQTTIFKGIAILMMLFYHLYGGADIEQWCTPLIYVGDKPLVGLLSRACYPVTFFLIFTGYGLSYSFYQGKLTIVIQIRRLLRLYIFYWVISVVFVSIGMVVDPSNYPKSWLHVVANITAIHCTYNGEAWFLFPYMLICLSSLWVVRWLMAIRKPLHVLLAIVIYAVCLIGVKHIVVTDSIVGALLLQPVYYVVLLFYFSLGVILYRWIDKRGTALLKPAGDRTKTLPAASSFMSLVAFSLLLILIIIKSCFKVTLADGLYALAFIVLLLQFSWKGVAAHVLSRIGKHATAMWLTHTYFAVYLFPGFIHAPRYPVLIFLLLVVVSWLSAFPLEWLSQKVLSYVFTKRKDG